MFYGFRYNTKNMDAKVPGDKISKGEILYASTSYDDDGNYRYGKNLCSAYCIDPYTIEDAFVISESAARATKYTDVHDASISINDNDILANLYGTDEDYKCFPDIGEPIKEGIIACTKRINNEQLLYTLKKQNLRSVNFATDTPYYLEHGIIEDIFIYSNKTLEEIPDSRFYKQIKKYLVMQEEFYTNMKNTCEEIMNSGSKYSEDIPYYFKKAEEYLNGNMKWVSENNIAFSNMIIEFEISQLNSIADGQKFTGRSGNKGVVAKVMPDDQMPITEYGKRVDILVNALGVINRENSFQSYEHLMNFISDLAVEQLKVTDDLKEKEKIVFTILEYLNDDVEATEKIKSLYEESSQYQKEQFFESVIENGIYYKINPLWEREDGRPIFYRISELMDIFPWIKPTNCYIEKFGRRIKIMRPMIVADLYYLRLRQSSKKGYTARSTGSISKMGVPEKSNKAKKHQDTNPKTPVRLGNMETNNLLIGVKPEVLADLHKYYRSSVQGRQELGTRLLSTIGELESLRTDNVMPNTNVQILNAYLKVLGIRINFSETEKEYVRFEDGKIIEWEFEDGQKFLGTRTEYENFIDRERAKKFIEEDRIHLTSGESYEKRLEYEISRFKHMREGTIIEIPED